VFFSFFFFDAPISKDGIAVKGFSNFSLCQQITPS